ncbi:LAME_0H19702g1_1 [Lachancea meyersii CBS 8951]|uniref:LAME_0H19702g1_1 n=1 Tax=Lachancea meyersii CBS 8951 TaxID=1266667 RepID=A0A1G4KJJ5_9SACH|nr:LAME_0H19702g1_1 [Lachancea meyersii CBS 8951]
MSFTFPTTPTKQTTSQAEARPSSCLKQNRENQSQQELDGHRNNVSQVRFSLPVEPDVDTETQSNLGRDSSPTHHPTSPTKVVYPRSSEDYPSSHFVDFKHKIMVDVPEHIWQSHYDRRNTESSSSSLTKRHSRAQSLQSVIADTLQTYHTKPSNNQLGLLTNSPLPNLQAAELYLRSDSPLNKYQVAVPLEASLPPYLSPENKSKRRNSFVYDGEGYSMYLSDSSDVESLGLQASDSEILKADQSSSQCSDLSIPSATHDFSFDGKEDVDKILGIDADANVNLKKQARNLLNRSPGQKGKSLPQIPKPPIFKISQKTDAYNDSRQIVTRPRGATADDSPSEALKILTSPSKTIIIPTFEQASSKPTTTSVARFFSEMDDTSAAQNIQLPETSSKDEINANFQFPSPFKADSDEGKLSEVSYSHGGTDTPEVEDENSFERRRKLLRQQSNGSNFRRHTHNRTRSIHGSQDLFIESHTPPKTGPKEMNKVAIPERSPRRGFSRNSKPFDGNHNEIKVDAISTPTKNTEHESLPEASIAHPIRPRIQSIPHHPLDLPSLKNNNPNFADRTEGVATRDQINSKFDVSHPIMPQEDSNLQKTKSGESPVTHFFACITNNNRSDISASSSSCAESNAVEEEVDSGKSFEILEERKVEKVTPLSTYHSFKAPLNPPETVKTESLLDTKNMENDRHFSTRQLSNNVSHSSSESKDSIPSRSSVATAYSQANENYLSQPFKHIQRKTESPFVTRRDSKVGFSPKISERADIGRLQPKTLREYIGGELVDVVLLDDPEDTATAPEKGRPRSFHEDALEHFHEILDLCDKTADRAKGVILDLVETPEIPRASGSNYSRSPPSYNPRQTPVLNSPYSGKTSNSYIGSSRESPSSKYVSNLDRLRALARNR